ncbi:DUF1552 domain-containing protein [Roseiconus lacunae]|uniref:DUF1552 domain-containing protein n=1 Tax=Roseiconus lacunae TaxID=2605694 RepID=A0ABT7PNJ6_9BACT|nr:DUF1552 domain-containing protein [Roseiconus lacunae]MDM4017903.1 DUF1552 domain-containing protein [Roseiconus lacunae]
MSLLKNPIQPKRLDRRTLLRGTGAVLGLPLLEAMTPMAHSAYASADSVKRPVRMACVFFPNGVIVPEWTPIVGESGDPRDWKCSPTLEPLSPMKDKINVFRNLTLDNGRGYKDGAGDHARCGATFLTAARPLKTSGIVRLGVSVDQVAASHLAGQTRLPSIELGLEGSRNAGSCDSGYSCAYSSNISWRSESQPMPKETIPRLAFERLFGSGDAHERREKNRVRRSILDVVRGDAKNLMKGLGKTDTRKMDEYFSGIREIEQRIEQSERDDAAALPDIEVPFGRVEAFREHARLMFDLMVIAFQTDSTRVATMMLDNAGGNRRYTEIGISDSHHGMSHHRNKEDLVGKLAKIDRYLVEQFAYFLQKLDSTSDAGGSLLDQSMVLYGSGISDGNRHRHEDLPIIMAGGASGQIETGRYIDAGEECPMANLFLSMLDIMGTPAESIGDSTGRLTI